MTVVTLVPWRGGNPDREATWDIVRPELGALGWPVITGDSDGPWARAAACNAAAAKAGEWDVALFADADTIPEPDAVFAAVEHVAAHGGAMRPHDHLWALTQGETRMFLRWPPQARHRFQARHRNLGGGLLVVSREAFDRIGGYDERFVGWGHEDSDINTRLLAYVGWELGSGNAWHLWHPRDDAHTPERSRNRAMMVDVQRRHRQSIRRASERAGYDVGSVL